MPVEIIGELGTSDKFTWLQHCLGLVSRKGSALKNLAGALHADGGGCTLLVDRKVRMEIPIHSLSRIHVG
jgi:hypothetical protein